MDMASRLNQTKERINNAARSCGRNPAEITLIAVSKTHPLEAVIEAARLGQVHFGESYIQEAILKLEDLSTEKNLDAKQKDNLIWHFIGHLQSRKARDAAGRFDLIHTVDSYHLAQTLHKRMEQLLEATASDTSVNNLLKKQVQDVLVQVNIGQEEQKSGVSEADLPSLVEQVLGLPNLKLKGLMCIPPFGNEPEASQPYFAKLRMLRDDLENKFGKGTLPHLSMGMSQDFEFAIAEGATLIRVGTDIFGERVYT